MNALDRLLRPRSIAVVGGGPWGRSVLRRCREMGFAGPLWPVHPTAREVEGLTACPSVDALPAPPDAVFVGVNRTATVEVVRALAAMGAGGAVCFAAGFREAAAELADGAALQDALVAAAGAMPILGPNCYGFLNYLDGAALWPDQHGGRRVARGVAIVTQSSNIALNLTMQRRALPLAAVATVGNQAQTGLSAVGRAWLADPRITALGLHIEGIDDLDAFEALAMDAHRLGKPVVALKVGTSEGARAGVVSHSASLAGSEAGGRALLDRLGVGRVATLPALLETLKLLHGAGPLPSARIVSLSCSGGEASLMADLGEGRVTFPPFAAGPKAALREALGPGVALANPLDYNTYVWGDRAGMTAAFTAAASGDAALAAIVLDFPRADRCDGADWDLVVDCAAEAARATGTPVAILSSLPETMPEDRAEAIAARGLVPLAGMAEALEAIATAAAIGTARPPAPAHRPKVLRGRLRTLAEAEAKALLAQAGLAVPPGRRVASVEEAVDAARQLGFPIVLKGEGFAHKSEAGAVRLNLRDEAAVRAAAGAMPGRTFLVERMVEGGLAELLVGVTRDPAHGMVLTLGAGGTLAELVQDTASLLLPTDESAIAEALAGLRIARLLDGFRGAPAADRPAILRAILAVARFALAEPVAEVEVNPLICGADFAIAADALVTMADEEESDDA